MTAGKIAHRTFDERGLEQRGISKVLATELSMIGVRCERPDGNTLPFDDWVSNNTRKAERMFGNQGVRPAAIWLAALHPRAIDYLEQAPVLALAATFGGKASSRSERAYVAMNFKPLIERGARLRDVMAAFRVAYPLRALSPTAIRPGIWSIVQAISANVDPSTIAQAIPAVPTRHMRWLGDLDALWSALRTRADAHDGEGEKANAAILRWAMLALSRAVAAKEAAGSECGELADFLVCNRNDFNPRWTWRKLIDESTAWHVALANAQIDKINDGKYDTDVPYGAFPAEVVIHHDAKGGCFEFHALRSLRALVIEGKAMHHCVASYYRDIQSGRARIYSVRKDGRRVATAEFVSLPGRISARQVKGVCNARPAKDVLTATDVFARCMTEAGTNNPKALRGQPAATRDAFLNAGKGWAA